MAEKKVQPILAVAPTNRQSALNRRQAAKVSDALTNSIAESDAIIENLITENESMKRNLGNTLNLIEGILLNKSEVNHIHDLTKISQSSAATYDSPQWNGSTWVARDIHASINRIVMSSELDTLGEFAAIGTGTSVSNSLITPGLTFNGRVGFLHSSTGTTNLGVAGVGTVMTDQIVLGTYETNVCDIVRIPVLSTASDRFAVDCGLTDNRTGGVTAPINGVFFQYSDNTNAGNWLCVCMNNNTPIVIDSGIVVTAETWYRLEIKIDTTQARFYINGILVATLNGIPTGTTCAVGKSALIRKSVGIVASILINDYTHFIQGTAR